MALAVLAHEEALQNNRPVLSKISDRYIHVYCTVVGKKEQSRPLNFVDYFVRPRIIVDLQFWVSNWSYTAWRPVHCFLSNSPYDKSRTGSIFASIRLS